VAPISCERGVVSIKHRLDLESDLGPVTEMPQVLKFLSLPPSLLRYLTHICPLIGHGVVPAASIRSTHGRHGVMWAQQGGHISPVAAAD